MVTRGSSSSVDVYKSTEERRRMCFEASKWEIVMVKASAHKRRESGADRVRPALAHYYFVSLFRFNPKSMSIYSLVLVNV